MVIGYPLDITDNGRKQSSPKQDGILTYKLLLIAINGPELKERLPTSDSIRLTNSSLFQYLFTEREVGEFECEVKIRLELVIPIDLS